MPDIPVHYTNVQSKCVHPMSFFEISWNNEVPQWIPTPMNAQVHQVSNHIPTNCTCHLGRGAGTVDSPYFICFLNGTETISQIFLPPAALPRAPLASRWRETVFLLFGASRIYLLRSTVLMGKPGGHKNGWVLISLIAIPAPTLENFNSTSVRRIFWTLVSIH